MSRQDKSLYNENTKNCNENPKKLFEFYDEEFSIVFNKAKEINNNLDKKYSNFVGEGSGSINKLSDDNYIIKLINQFNNYLSNLSIIEICLVINISSCIFILTCLVTILFATYGNILIDKLNLVAAEKYPKLASFIKLRIKLQHTYVFINTLLILIALVLMVIINFITLTNG